MNAEEIRLAALFECAGVPGVSDVPHSICYRRIGTRQQQLFALAAKTNPDYYGTSAVGALDANKAADLSDLGTGAPRAELIERIEIRDAGTSSYATGREVNVVLPHDTGAAFAPRVTIRDNVIRPIGNDLAGVISIEVFYSRRPAMISTATAEVELDGAFTELLVFDLAKYLLSRSPADADTKTLLGGRFAEAETALLVDYEKSVGSYTPRVVTRFAR